MEPESDARSERGDEHSWRDGPVCMPVHGRGLEKSRPAILPQRSLGDLHRWRAFPSTAQTGPDWSKKKPYDRSFSTTHPPRSAVPTEARTLHTKASLPDLSEGPPAPRF